MRVKLVLEDEVTDPTQSQTFQPYPVYHYRAWLLNQKRVDRQELIL